MTPPTEERDCLLVEEQCERCERLLERQQVHLAQIAKLSQTVPLESEVAEALNQRGALLAEVGTLRSRALAAESRAERAEALLREARKNMVGRLFADRPEDEYLDLRARIDAHLSGKAKEE